MKKIVKRIFTGIITLLIISTIFITAFAALYSDISAKTTRIGSVATTQNCSNMGGISVTASGSNKRLFVVKSKSSEDKAVLYMYKDYTTMDNSSDDEYGRFILSDFVGHANGMAIDDNYIYITCWKKTDGTNGNRIARIKRSTLWSMYKSTTDIDKGTLTADSDGCTVMPVVNSDGTSYDGKITSITYYKNGQFIVNYNNYGSLYSGVTLDTTNKVYFAYTTAQISNGKLVINNNKSDVFLVSFTSKDTTGQDIGYDPDCGFFIVRWHTNTAKNSIIWVKLNSLSGENRIYENDNSKYRIIKVNKSSNIFSTYEVESVSIGSDNCMYANVNTVTKEGYEQYSRDAIIKVERPTEAGGSTNFLGYYFAQ